MTDPVAPNAGGQRRGFAAWLALLVRGMAMGIAELVPGISGGTIAFVTGIYDELLTTLARLHPRALLVLQRHGWRAFWRDLNGSFLLVLVLGMGVAIVSLARLLGWLLDEVPVLVWAFFFGLIAASVVQIGRRRAARTLATYGVLGLLLGLAMLELGHRQGAAPLWLVFIGGMVAISAWLLPAVSGSFMLLVMGLYEPVLRAFNAGEWAVPLTLALGCAAGLICFARLLHWLMRRVRESLLALLTGFMAGSLATLWPWQWGGELLSPAAYAAAAGAPALTGAALAIAGLGVVTLWLLSRLE